MARAKKWHSYSILHSIAEGSQNIWNRDKLRHSIVGFRLRLLFGMASNVNTQQICVCDLFIIICYLVPCVLYWIVLNSPLTFHILDFNSIHTFQFLHLLLQCFNFREQIKYKFSIIINFHFTLINRCRWNNENYSIWDVCAGKFSIWFRYIIHNLN